MGRIFILAAVLAVCSGCQAAKTPQGSEDGSPLDGRNRAAEEFLAGFFEDLSKGKFEKAVGKFAPEIQDAQAWEWMAGFGENAGENKPGILKSYCAAVGTCLPAEIVSSSSGGEDVIAVKTRFIKPDGGVFVLGPCCGATEEEMPPQDTFEYMVKRTSDGFKVLTAPQYVP